MSEVLLNQKEASKRKELRSIQKQSKREYGRGKSIVKAKIGKLTDVDEVQEYAVISNGTRNKPDMEEFLNLLRELQLTGMSGNGCRGSFSVIGNAHRRRKDEGSKICNGVWMLIRFLKRSDRRVRGKNTYVYNWRSRKDYGNIKR